MEPASIPQISNAKGFRVLVEELDRLIEVLAKLPAIGRRSAERMAMRLIGQRSHALLKQLAAALDEADQQLSLCCECGAITTKTCDPCKICADPRRDPSLVCVVEGPGDVVLMERAGVFQGKYHVLGGKLSPARSQGSENLSIARLTEKVRRDSVREILLALNTDVESDATVQYLHELLDPYGVLLTRIAMGIPSGGGISYADPVTLKRAVSARQSI